jgi:hypothetical protein
MSIDTLGETNNSSLLVIIQQLSKSNIPFGLTGSRFFECSNPLSDYDFFSPNTQETKDFLISIGLQKLDNIIYNYVGIKQIKEHPKVLKNSNNVAEVWGKNGVPLHIQLVDDFDLKKRIQDVIKKSKLMMFFKNSCQKTPFPKQFMIQIWNLFYDLTEISSSEEKIQAEVEKRLNEHNEQRIQEEIERRFKMKELEKETQTEIEKDVRELLD